MTDAPICRRSRRHFITKSMTCCRWAKRCSCSVSAVLEEGDIYLTEKGRAFVQADVDGRRALFAEALLAHVPLANMIRQVLDERWNHRASAVRFRDELEDHMSPDYAAATLRTVIGWGRYAELFSYDEEAEQFSLEDLE